MRHAKPRAAPRPPQHFPNDEVPVSDGEEDDEMVRAAQLHDVDMGADSHPLRGPDSPVHSAPAAGSAAPKPTCGCTDGAFFMITFVGFSLLFVGVQLCRVPALAWTLVSLTPIVLVLMLARIVYPAPARHVCVSLYVAVAVSSASLLSLVACAVMDAQTLGAAPSNGPSPSTTPSPTLVPTTPFTFNTTANATASANTTSPA